MDGKGKLGGGLSALTDLITVPTSNYNARDVVCQPLAFADIHNRLKYSYILIK